LHRAELTVCCRLIRFSWHGASCTRDILRFSTVSSPEVQKRRGADVDFKSAWAHVSNQEHQVSPRGASDWWRESVRKSVSVHQDKIRGSAIQTHFYIQNLNTPDTRYEITKVAFWSSWYRQTTIKTLPSRHPPSPLKRMATTWIGAPRTRQR